MSVSNAQHKSRPQRVTERRNVPPSLLRKALADEKPGQLRVEINSPGGLVPRPLVPRVLSGTRSRAATRHGRRRHHPKPDRHPGPEMPHISDLSFWVSGRVTPVLICSERGINKRRPVSAPSLTLLREGPESTLSGL
jgi:hypothetical protein